MKKIILICSIVFVFVLVSGYVVADRYFSDELQDFFDSGKLLYNTDDKKIIATVFGEPIYQENIDFLVNSKEFSLKNTPQGAVENTEIPDIDVEVIIDEQIRNLVILNEAKKQGLEVTYERAKEYEEEMFAFVEENKESEQSQFIYNFINETGMTVTEYREKTVDVYRNMLTRAALYEKFAEGKDGTYDEIVAQYEVYIDSLVEKAEIVYK